MEKETVTRQKLPVTICRCPRQSTERHLRPSLLICATGKRRIHTRAMRLPRLGGVFRWWRWTQLFLLLVPMVPPLCSKPSRDAAS
jgi:hypothetical protein